MNQPPAAHWQMPTDPSARLMVMSSAHPYWKAADAIHYRAGREKCLRLRCGHRQKRLHAQRAVEAWDAETRRLLGQWERSNRDVMNAPPVHQAMAMAAMRAEDPAEVNE